jgi:hypothetical protein
VSDTGRKVATLIRVLLKDYFILDFSSKSYSGSLEAFILPVIQRPEALLMSED